MNGEIDLKGNFEDMDLEVRAHQVQFTITTEQDKIKINFFLDPKYVDTRKREFVKKTINKLQKLVK